MVALELLVGDPSTKEVIDTVHLCVVKGHDYPGDQRWVDNYMHCLLCYTYCVKFAYSTTKIKKSTIVQLMSRHCENEVHNTIIMENLQLHHQLMHKTAVDCTIYCGTLNSLSNGFPLNIVRWVCNDFETWPGAIDGPVSGKVL